MATPITLYVSDLDGTLLNPEAKISATTADILSRLIADEGLLFTIATARTPATAVPMTEAIGIRLPMIVMTGAAKWVPIENRYIDTSLLPAEKVAEIVEICHSGGINPFIYDIDTDETLRVSHCEELNRGELSFIEERVNSPFKHFYLHNPLKVGQALLMYACNDFERISQVHARVQQSGGCEAICYHDIYNANQGFLEVFAPGTSKAAAIRQLAKSIGAERIVVFGDNLNDIPMLRCADVAVAVENAYPEVKQMAHVVIGPNSSDSVARWILEHHNQM